MEQGTEIGLGAALSIRGDRAPVLLLQELASAKNSRSPKADSSLEAPEERSARRPPRLPSHETPSKGPPRAYMTSDPQNHEIIKKCVLTGGTKVVVICYTSRERSLKSGLGDLRRELEFVFCVSVRLFCPTLERKATMIYLTSTHGCPYSGRL